MNPWTTLGAFVYTGANLSTDTIHRFAAVGGRWLAPVVYNDDAAGPGNLALLPWFKGTCASLGIEVWGWFNGQGGDPVKDATAIGDLVNAHGLAGAILDLEAAYQYPQGDANLMPVLVSELRKRQPSLNIAVSTNGLNGSMIWNGRTLPVPKAFYDLKVRVLPQWCYGPAYTGCWVDPVCNMTWLKDKGPTDGNMCRKGIPSRAVPLSYVHPTLEVTGLEGAVLASGLAKLKAAKKLGFTSGLSLYTLENAPDSDFDLLAAVRGTLYF